MSTRKCAPEIVDFTAYILQSSEIAQHFHPGIGMKEFLAVFQCEPAWISPFGHAHLGKSDVLLATGTLGLG